MRHTIFAILLLLTTALHAQQEFRGRVVDAETGEPLPYASIYVAEGKGTLTNEDGNFLLRVKPKEELKISFVGYNPKTINAADIPNVVKLRPMTKVLHEVQVIPIETIILKIIKKLNKENERHVNAKSHYFFRLSSSMPPQGDFIVEAFFNAFSTININIPEILNGRKYISLYDQNQVQEKDFFLKHSNLHQLLSLGPEVPQGGRNTIMKTINVPLPEWAKEISDLEGREFSYTEFISETGKEFYKINVKVNPEISAALDSEKPVCNDLTLSPSHALSGTLFIEKKTLILQRFEGELTGFSLREYNSMGERLTPIKILINIDYSHSRKFTEPVTIHCSITCADKKWNLIAFKVKEKKLYDLKPRMARENMITAIERTEYDSTLWTSDIILRSQKEEEIVRRATQADSIR